MHRRSVLVSAIAAFGAFALVGCASMSPPQEAPTFSPAPPAPEGMATLYIFRPFMSQNGMAVWPVTSLNGVKVADVKVGSYTYVYLKLGHYKISSEKSQFLTFLDNVPGEFDVAEPRDYYLAFVTSGGSFLAPVGKSVVSMAGPTNHTWRMLSSAEAMNFYLPKMRYLPAHTQALSE